MNFDWHNEKRRIKDLVPYVANPRQITEKQAKDLKASLERFGVADPIIINTDNTIIGGHQRKKILETLMGVDPDYEIDVRVPDRELSIDEMRELNVRLNKNQGEWNFDTLANNFELDDLLDWGFEKSDLDLDLWMPDPPEDAEPQIDRAEELREVWGVETGQLWQLGEHRLICGDCTDKAIVDRVMGGEKMGLCVTSPPYYNQREYSQWDSFDDYMQFTRNVIGPIIDNADNEFALVWNIGDQCASEETKDIPAYHSILFEDMGLKYRDKIIWKKSGAVFDIPRSQHIENGHYFPALGHETILVYTKKHPMFDIADKKQVREWQINVWEFRQVRSNSETGHPAEYPEELPTRAVICYTTKDKIVYEPFSGGGTSIIACERFGRKCRAVEISPAYVAVAIQRWVDVTGGTPLLIDED